MLPDRKFRLPQAIVARICKIDDFRLRDNDFGRVVRHHFLSLILRRALDRALRLVAGLVFKLLEAGRVCASAGIFAASPSLHFFDLWLCFGASALHLSLAIFTVWLPAGGAGLWHAHEIVVRSVVGHYCLMTLVENFAGRVCLIWSVAEPVVGDV